jgi:hypothetical protein
MHPDYWDICIYVADELKYTGKWVIVELKMKILIQLV